MKGNKGGGGGGSGRYPVLLELNVSTTRMVLIGGNVGRGNPVLLGL